MQVVSAIPAFHWLSYDGKLATSIHSQSPLIRTMRTVTNQTKPNRLQHITLPQRKHATPLHSVRKATTEPTTLQHTSSFFPPIYCSWSDNLSVGPIHTRLTSASSTIYDVRSHIKLNCIWMLFGLEFVIIGRAESSPVLLEYSLLGAGLRGRRIDSHLCPCQTWWRLFLYQLIPRGDKIDLIPVTKEFPTENQGLLPS